MSNDLLSTSKIGIEDITGAILELEPVNDIAVVYDEKYIGSCNALSGSIEFTTDGLDIAKNLFKETASEIYLEDTLGNRYKGHYHNAIANIHRIRKGKRYIIKFDYAGTIEFIGTKIGE